MPRAKTDAQPTALGPSKSDKHRHRFARRRGWRRLWSAREELASAPRRPEAGLPIDGHGHKGRVPPHYPRLQLRAR